MKKFILTAVFLALISNAHAGAASKCVPFSDSKKMSKFQKAVSLELRETMAPYYDEKEAKRNGIRGFYDGKQRYKGLYYTEAGFPVYAAKLKEIFGMSACNGDEFGLNVWRGRAFDNFATSEYLFPGKEEYNERGIQLAKIFAPWVMEQKDPSIKLLERVLSKGKRSGGNDDKEYLEFVQQFSSAVGKRLEGQYDRYGLRMVETIGNVRDEFALPNDEKLVGKIFDDVEKVIESDSKYDDQRYDNPINDALAVYTATSLLTSGHPGSGVSKAAMLKIADIYASPIMEKRLTEMKYHASEEAKKAYKFALPNSFASYVMGISRWEGWSKDFSQEEILVLVDKLVNTGIAKPKYYYSYDGKGRPEIQIPLLGLLNKAKPIDERSTKILLDVLNMSGKSREEWHFTLSKEDAKKYDPQGNPPMDIRMMSAARAVEYIMASWGKDLPGADKVFAKLAELKGAKAAGSSDGAEKHEAVAE